MKPRMVISYGSPFSLALKILSELQTWVAAHGFKPFAGTIHMSISDVAALQFEDTVKSGYKFKLWETPAIAEDIKPGTAYLVGD